jgi:hypothetical protein
MSSRGPTGTQTSHDEVVAGVIDQESIDRTLGDIASALTAGDAARIAELWDVPALVLADQGARAVATRAEVEAFFRASIAWYREQGTPTALPTRERWERISERVAAVDVTWRAIGASGEEKSSESSHYLMRLGDDGVARVQVAMSRVER